MAKAQDTKTTVKTVKEKAKKAEKVVKPQFIPRATEKAYGLQAKRTYMFYAPLDASKQVIAEAISNGFNVTVTDVRVNVRKGKKTRFSRGKHAYPGTTFRRDHKVAYVTLKEGDKIAVFEEEEDKKSTKTSDKKADKKAEKAAKKEAKTAAKKGDK